MYVSLLVKYAMSSTNTLTYNNSNGLYLVCQIGCEIINKVLSHSTLELVQGVLVHVHTTLLSSLIYCMTHHQKSYVAKSTNNYLTTIGDALNGRVWPELVSLIPRGFKCRFLNAARRRVQLGVQWAAPSTDVPLQMEDAVRGRVRPDPLDHGP